MFKLISPLPPATEPYAAKNLVTGAMFPFVRGNSDYEFYLKWLEEGNTPEPADELSKE